ncbi:MAG: MBL fold metallo-hydrolase [Opitutaceae bacterium]
MKAIIWGSCGSLPSPASSSNIRQKVKDALWAARGKAFDSERAVDDYLDSLPHYMHGTYKANTSCVQIDAGLDEVIICDAGTGLRDYSLTIPADAPPRTYHIFVSHLHWDHIQGFPFFAPAYAAGNRIIFHGFHETIEDTIRDQMRAPWFPVQFEAMKADIEFDIRKDGASFSVGTVDVKTIKQQHPGDSWGYRFEQGDQSIIYSSDSEHGPEAQELDYPFVDFFRDASILIFDGQYTFEDATNAKRHWGHSDHITAVELASRAGVKKLAISHHEPSYSDRSIEALGEEALRYRDIYNKNDLGCPKSIIIAYDGLVIEA